MVFSNDFAARATQAHEPGASSEHGREFGQTDTKPTIELRRLLPAGGLRFRKDLHIDLPGGQVRPDIVFARRKVDVFVDSCFWHVCPEHGREPTSNEWYWTRKAPPER